MGAKPRQPGGNDGPDMGDRIFFPAAALTAVGLVAFAATPPGGRLPTGSVSVGDGQYDRIIVDGAELNRMKSGAAELSLVGESGVETLRVTLEDDGLLADPTLGPHFRLAADIEAQFATFLIRTTVRARAVGDAPAQAIEINYRADADNESGWGRYPLEADFADFTLEFKAPPRGETPAVDYLGIRPLSGSGRASMEIERVTLERIIR